MSTRASPPRPIPPDADAPLRHSIDVLASLDAPLVLAVSGGADSMALMHAMARWAPERVAVVATFDHGTGAFARESTSLVAAEARRLGLPVVRQRAFRPASTEAGWRDARWAFLNRVARAHTARVATAHSADDQAETVAQRILRGSGARGLAALAAPTRIVRPWLERSRAELRGYVERHAVPFLDDPANLDRRHQRVRLRLDLLPALEAASPGFTRDLLRIGGEAGAWRREVEALVDRLPWRSVHAGVWHLDRSAVLGWTPEMLAVLWPALLGRLGVTLGAEGTRRVIRFTIGDARAGELQLPGGAVVVRVGDVFEVRAPSVVATFERARSAPPARFASGARLVWPGWRITPLSTAPANSDDPSVLALPAGAEVQVRGWQPGDRIVTPQARAGRRIARYLSEAGVPRHDRSAWPVVLDAGVVVWVPGVCRGLAAPHRSGRSDLIWYRSEREFS